MSSPESPLAPRDKLAFRKQTTGQIKRLADTCKEFHSPRNQLECRDEGQNIHHSLGPRRSLSWQYPKFYVSLPRSPRRGFDLGRARHVQICNDLSALRGLAGKGEGSIQSSDLFWTVNVTSCAQWST